MEDRWAHAASHAALLTDLRVARSLRVLDPLAPVILMPVKARAQPPG